MRRNPWKWFGVKTVYRTVAEGEPEGIDSFFDPGFSLVEERVVLFRARSHDEALRLAEREAEEYAKDDSCPRNPYGQSLSRRFLGSLDSFEIYDFEGSGSEIYSRTEDVDMTVTDETVLERTLGPLKPTKTFARRRNIMDIVFVEPAPGVEMTEAELRTARRLRAALK